jgi:hypothetical protein
MNIFHPVKPIHVNKLLLRLFLLTYKPRRIYSIRETNTVSQINRRIFCPIEMKIHCKKVSELSLAGNIISKLFAAGRVWLVT